MKRIVAAVGVVLVASCASGVSPSPAAETAATAWWPEFHGPNRDNISPEKGLLKQWPQGGPELKWTFSPCGGGHSGVSLAEGMIFTAGDFDDAEMVIALDTDGKLRWKSPNGKSWTGPHPGSRTTPTYRDGTLYQMNPTGRLTAFRAASGERIWSVDLQAEFGARYGTWAMAENVVIDGELVLCVPGGPKGFVVALNRKTGATVWANTARDETAAYCSGVLVTYRGVRQLITMAQRSVIGVDVRTGALLWSYPRQTRHDQNVTTPIFHDGYVFAAAGHSTGGTLLRLAPNSRGVTEVWTNRSLDNCHGGVILADGRLYGSGCRSGGKGFFCADFLTGKCLARDDTLPKLSLTCAEGMLYGLTDRGQMLLMAITPDGFEIISRFEVPGAGRSPFFAHPVICGGRLYLRHDDNLYAYDIRADY